MFQLLAVCPMGLEAVVAKKYKNLVMKHRLKMGASSLKVMKQQSLNATYGYVQLTALR